MAATLSIILTTVNDPELNPTIQSIRDTAGDKPEVIVVDDSSSTPVDAPQANRVIHNHYRCGVGPSRHIGALAATGEFVLLVDSHMRFVPGWYEETVRRIEGRPHTIHCATCLGLDRDHMDPMHPNGEYNGATLNLFGPDKAPPHKMQVMEAIWMPRGTVKDDAELACVMGACYIIQRDFFLKLGALRFLKSWGADEVMLSLKCWLAGGDIRYLEKARIGHKFSIKGDRNLFDTPPGHPTWNKLFAIHTLLPTSLAERMDQALRQHADPKEWSPAWNMMRAEWSLFAQEQEYNRTLFKRPFQWFADKFGVTVPA